MKLGLEGQRAIVTGGSRGIGKAVIDNFVEEKMKVATCARGAQALSDVVTEWEKSGNTVFNKAIDVSNEVAYKNWFEASVEHLGGLDVFVSNVSCFTDGEGIQKWKDRFEVDLLQHIRATELALPYLKKGNNPSIVYVSSIASIMNSNMPTEVEYGTMKAALISYAAQLATQVGQYGIRVNVVSPGPIIHANGYWESVKKDNPENYKRVESLSVFNRLGTSEEVANAITFLSSSAASNITATNLRVDGGTIKTVNF